MSIVEPISTPDAAQCFDNLWSKLKVTPDLPSVDYPLMNVGLADAVRLGRMSYSLTGTPLRGMRLAGVGISKYILVFGEYGHLILDNPAIGTDVIFAKSQSYCFYDELDAPTRRMDELVTECLLAGLKVSTLIQWYDSVYRRQSGRHVSPHFDPVKSLDKSSAAILPGLQLLRKFRS